MLFRDGKAPFLCRALIADGWSKNRLIPTESSHSYYSRI